MRRWGPREVVREEGRHRGLLHHSQVFLVLEQKGQPDGLGWLLAPQRQNEEPANPDRRSHSPGWNQNTAPCPRPTWLFDSVRRWPRRSAERRRGHSACGSRL